MTSKFEYRVFDVSALDEPGGPSEGASVESILNEQAAKGWVLDRFWDSQDGQTRHLLMHREARVEWKKRHELTSLYY